MNFKMVLFKLCNNSHFFQCRPYTKYFSYNDDQNPNRDEPSHLDQNLDGNHTNDFYDKNQNTLNDGKVSIGFKH